MSALGEYVHLNAFNYLRYGVTRGEEGGSSQPAVIAKEDYIIRQLTHKGINEPSDEEKENLEELKKYYERNSDKKIAEGEKKADAAFKRKLDWLYEYMAKMTNRSIFGRYAGSSNGWSIEGSSAIPNSPYYEAVKNTLPETREQIKDRVKRLNEVKDAFNKLGSSASGDKVQELIKKYNDVITGTGYGSIAAAKNENNYAILQEALDNTLFFGGGTFGQDNLSSGFIGKFGEALSVICADNIDNLSKEEFFKFLNNSVKGDTTSSIILDANALAVPSAIVGERYSEDTRNYKIGVSQNKVDAVIEFNGQSIFATVKNYSHSSESGSKNVTLQKDTNLLYSLIELNKENDYGTHWLNTHLKYSYGHSSKEAEVNRKAQGFDNLLEGELAIEALITGNPLKEQSNNNSSANVFILFDRYNGKVAVYSTYDMIVNNFKNFVFNPIPRSIRFDNKQANSEEERIGLLLTQAHQKSIHVSLRASKLF